MSDPTLLVTDKRTSMPTLVPKELDDAGLDPFEFRVYARMARRAGRGISREGIRNMAAGCLMSTTKLQMALAVLQDTCLVRRVEATPGHPVHYELTDQADWRLERLEAARERARLTFATSNVSRGDTPATVSPGDTSTCHGVTHSVSRGDTEGNPGREPTKETPRASAAKAKKPPLPALPEELAALPGFPARWESWLAYRRERKIPMTRAACSLQWANLARYRAEGHDLLAVIDYSISQGYRSLFPPPKLPGPAVVRGQSDGADPQRDEIERLLQGEA